MKKVGILVLALVLALGGLGVGYAHWSKTLTIAGQVKTGSIAPYFNAQWTNDGCSAVVGEPNNDRDECGTWTGFDTEAPDTSNPVNDARYKSPLKDVGCTDCDIISDTSASICITNGYPCYRGNVLFEIRNKGSVPAIVHSIQLTAVSFGGTNYPLATPIDMLPGDVVSVDIDGSPRAEKRAELDTDDFSIKWSNLGLDAQLDPELWPQDSNTPSPYILAHYANVCVHVADGIDPEMDATNYDFTIEIVYYNWGI